VSTPELQLRTLFVLSADGRIRSAREPGANRGPLFSLIRSTVSCAWAVRVDVPQEIASEIDRLAREEPPVTDFGDEPVHASSYVSLLSQGGPIRQTFGPAFEFPAAIASPADVVVVEDEALLQRHFRGWVTGEISEGRAPVVAVFENEDPVSVCFCARSSEVAAEAGVETAAPFRGRGFATRVTAAWALAIRASGRIPLYSTSWDNNASLAVARKLGLITYASDWSVCG
jgi:GNAT acetyltransferase